MFHKLSVNTLYAIAESGPSKKGHRVCLTNFFLCDLDSFFAEGKQNIHYCMQSLCDKCSPCPQPYAIPESSRSKTDPALIVCDQATPFALAIMKAWLSNERRSCVTVCNHEQFRSNALPIRSTPVCNPTKKHPAWRSSCVIHQSATTVILIDCMQ